MQGSLRQADIFLRPRRLLSVAVPSIGPTLSYLVPAIAAFASVQTWFRAGTFVASGDVPPFFRTNLIAELPSLWGHSLVGAGSPSFQPVARAPELGLLTFTRALGWSPMVAQRLFYSLLAVGAVLAAVWFVRTFISRPVPAMVGGLVAFFNPFVLQHLPNPLPLWSIGLMALLGLYVGILPVTLGMLWLPFVRRIDPRWLAVLMALTVGLLTFLAIDATLEGIDVAGQGSQALGGASLVFLGGLTSYLVLSGVESWLQGRRRRADSGAGGAHVALLVAIAIGLHNLGEGLAIGSSYAVGALALGAFLVVGFALHNTTEGLAIVAPVAARPPTFGRLALLGLIAGAPAILGAWIGASAFNSSVAAFLLGAGAGAIVQVIQQLAPSIRDRAGRVLHPASVAGILGGFAVLYTTSLLVSI